jgi:hypothetical protein
MLGIAAKLPSLGKLLLDFIKGILKNYSKGFEAFTCFIGNFDLTILEVIKKPLQGMILTWDTPIKDFFSLSQSPQVLRDSFLSNSKWQKGQCK